MCSLPLLPKSPCPLKILLWLATCLSLSDRLKNEKRCLSSFIPQRHIRCFGLFRCHLVSWQAISAPTQQCYFADEVAVCKIYFFRLQRLHSIVCHTRHKQWSSHNVLLRRQRWLQRCRHADVKILRGCKYAGVAKEDVDNKTLMMSMG